MAFTGPWYRTRCSGSMKRLGGVTAYGMPRNLLTVAVDDGKTVVVPMSRPGPTTAVGAWLLAAVTELSNASAQKTTEVLPNMSTGRNVHRDSCSIYLAAGSIVMFLF